MTTKERTAFIREELSNIGDRINALFAELAEMEKQEAMERDERQMALPMETFA